MNKSQQKLLQKIKSIMVDALLEGEFIILDYDKKIAPEFDEEFIVNRDEKDGSFLVLIKHVDY